MSRRLGRATAAVTGHRWGGTAIVRVELEPLVMGYVALVDRHHVEVVPDAVGRRVEEPRSLAHLRDDRGDVGRKLLLRGADMSHDVVSKPRRLGLEGLDPESHRVAGGRGGGETSICCRYQADLVARLTRDDQPPRQFQMDRMCGCTGGASVAGAVHDDVVGRLDGWDRHEAVALEAGNRGPVGEDGIEVLLNAGARDGGAVNPRDEVGGRPRDPGEELARGRTWRTSSRARSAQRAAPRVSQRKNEEGVGRATGRRTTRTTGAQRPARPSESAGVQASVEV